MSGPCQVPGHDHVPAEEDGLGFASAFCSPHLDALPKRLRAPLQHLTHVSIFDVDMHRITRLRLARALAWFKRQLTIPGICRVCGCTDDHACEVPCSWANARHTLCSNCVEERRRR